MAFRCGCYREGDATVFGESHECTVTPRPPADLPRFVPSSWFVVPRQDPHDLEMRANPFDMDDDERGGH